jgi:uncharacterized RDD family membrane protein YckC
MVLATIELGVALPLGKILTQIGGYAGLIGFLIGLLYFGTLNSYLGKGQTVGKKLFKLKVVDTNNQCLSLPKSMLRSIILLTPFFANFLFFVPGVNNLPNINSLVIFVSSIFAALGTSIFYLYIFNRTTRQSLHDLAVSSFVVKKNNEIGLNSLKTGRIHYIITILLIIVSLISTAVVPSFLIKTLGGDVEKMSSLYSSLNKLPSIYQSKVVTNRHYDSAGQTNFLFITLYSTEDLKDAEALTDTAARTVMEIYPEASKQDFILFKVFNGFDLGFVNFWQYYERTITGKSLIIAPKTTRQNL